MPAAPPGTETLSISRPDGSTITATVHYDPDSLAWADPAATVDGTGSAVLYLDNGDGWLVPVPIQAGIPVTAAVVIASGVAARGTGHLLLLQNPPA